MTQSSNAQKSLKEKKISLVGAHTESLNEALLKRGYNTDILPITHFPSFKKIKDSDVILGAYFHTAWPWFVISKLKRKKTICHWIGSDSLLAIQNWRRKLQTKIFTKFVDLHLAVSNRIKDELAEIGIESEVLFHGSDIKPEEISMPKKLGVLIYFMEGREKLYGLERVIEIAQRLKDVDFYFVGRFKPEKYTKNYNQKNLNFLGFTNLDELWHKISVIVRMTEHDGFPKTILEAYAKGRYVIHNYPLPGVILCQTNNEVIEELRKLQKTNSVNKDGLEIFKKEFHYEAFLEKFDKLCLSLF